jgi:hypothetical protein
MRTLFNKINLTETTNVNKYRDAELSGPGTLAPDLPYPRNGLGNLLTDTLKEPREEKPWAASDRQATE